MKIIKFWLYNFCIILILSVVVSCSSSGDQAQIENTLSDAEKNDGWQLLFDGKSLTDWQPLQPDSLPEGIWIVEDGSIKRVNPAEGPKLANGKPVPGGDLFSTRSYDNFEFVFDWKIATGSNSGVKYNVSKTLSVR